MAGIGFELKKLFHRRGLMAMLRAYGYAGVICAGPMLLGVLLQFGVLIVSGWWQVGRPDRDLLVCMITYTLLASLVLTSFLSMPVTRFLGVYRHHVGSGRGVVHGVSAVFWSHADAGHIVFMAVS